MSAEDTLQQIEYWSSENFGQLSTLNDKYDALALDISDIKDGLSDLSLGWHGYDDTQLLDTLDNLDVHEALESLPETLEYGETLQDIATLLSYTNVLLVLCATVIFLGVGVFIGTWVFRWFKAR